MVKLKMAGPVLLFGMKGSCSLTVGRQSITVRADELNLICFGQLMLVSHALEKCNFDSSFVYVNILKPLLNLMQSESV